jgi:hypothetical protein
MAGEYATPVDIANTLGLDDTRPHGVLFEFPENGRPVFKGIGLCTFGVSVEAKIRLLG